MNVSITVSPKVSESIKGDLQRLVAGYLRQHHVENPCVTVTDEGPENISGHFNPLFMHEAHGIYDGPAVASVAHAVEIPTSPEELVTDEVISREPALSILERQAPAEFQRQS